MTPHGFTRNLTGDNDKCKAFPAISTCGMVHRRQPLRLSTKVSQLWLHGKGPPVAHKG